MARDFRPHPYQRDILAFIFANPRCAIFAGMGLGKTSATLTAIDAIQLVEPGPALVLAPLRVAQSTWPDEAAKWAHLAHVRVSAVVGSAAQRAEALAVPAEVYTMNYDNLPWLVEHLAGRPWPFRTIVADEATRLKSFRLKQGGKRAASLLKIAHTQVDRFIELTGTPAPNGVKDLWGQAWFLDGGARLGRTHTGFIERWFRPDPSGYGSIPFDHSQGEIQEKLRDICVSINARDHFDISAPIVNTISVRLPPKVRRQYLDMEKAMFLEIENHKIEAFGSASKTLKCLQITNGAIYTNPEATEWAEVHDLKMQALESVIAEAAGMPVLVAYHFKSDLARLKARFPKGRELDKKPATLHDWNAGLIPLMFAHPASAGHGLNLQDGGNILVYFGLNWNLEEHDQILERIGPVRQLQAGHDRPVFVYRIAAEDTIDEIVLERLETKRDVQDLLLEFMARRKATR